ncbi:MAG TPA: hypothetical protein VK204_15355 [Nocardioidaceae bacterium]|nr:hypothetical protein [Nocardioidaceae bacterium]
MSTRLVTILILVAVTLGLIGWDVYAAIQPVSGSTISEVFLGFARQHPVLPFAFGVLGGHLCWPQTVKGDG